MADRFGLMPLFGGFLDDDDWFNKVFTNNFSNLTNVNDASIFNDGFSKTDNGYEVKIHLPEKVTDTHVSINVVDENVVHVTYQYTDKNSKMMGDFKYSLPKSADPNTLTAELDGQELVIKCSQKKEQEGSNRTLQIKK